MRTIGSAFLIFSMLGLAQRAGAPSQEELLKQVVAAIASKDEKVLEQLAISKDEFKKYVWPTVAMRVSGSNTNAEGFYKTYLKASVVGISEDLSKHGGKPLEIVRVSPGAVQKESKDYRLFAGPQVVVRGGNGQEQTIQLVGGLLEQGGSFKVTTYYVSPNRAGN